MPKHKPADRKQPVDVDVHVGSRIKMQRRIAGLSQGALAKALGITFQQVQKYENGRNRVSASRLQQIANAANVPVPLFFDGLESGQRVGGRDYAVEISNAIGGLPLARAFVRIKNKKLRKAVVELAAVLAETQDADETA